MHNSLTDLLTQVRDGKVSVADAALQLREAPFEDLGYARVDHHRRLRQGAAEVIYGAGKTPEQIAGIVDSLQRSGQKTVLITRMKPEAAAYLQERAALPYRHRRAAAGAGRRRKNRRRDRRYERHSRRRGGSAHSRGARKPRRAAV